ncbi:MAG TPA: exosortase/archaeosortase family protein, partial [Longimicrobiaceae bacterium]
AALLSTRDVPVVLSGNVIHLPGHSLFVTEACSGLRSLSALLAIGLLVAGLWLSTTAGRVVLLLLAVPVAVLLNAFRVFLTGFLVVFVDPRMGDGFMHLTEGWLIYLAALAVLGGLAWVIARVETRRAGVAA